MTKTEFLQSMTPKAAALTPAEEALAKTGIPPDVAYYAGALDNVERALASRKPTSETFWKSYQLSLCAHLGQLQDTDKEAEKQMIQTSIHTVQAILWALENMKG